MRVSKQVIAAMNPRLMTSVPRRASVAAK